MEKIEEKNDDDEDKMGYEEEKGSSKKIKVIASLEDVTKLDKHFMFEIYLDQNYPKS